MRTLRVMACAGILAAAGFGALAQSKTIIWPASAIKWTDSAPKGAKTAVLWGDPAKGAYGALKTLPAGGSIPMHSHTNDSRVVIVKGQITLEIEGRKHVVDPGSYTFIPGGVPHASTCGASTCEYFEEMPGPYDVKPAK